MLIHDDDLSGYYITQGSGYARLYRADPYKLLASTEHRDGQWRAVPTDVPMPWEMADRRFATPAEALTALVPYAIAEGASEQEMLALITATRFMEPR